MTKTERFVRTLYLYLFALLGLVFLSIGAIRLLDMGLRTFVFRAADRQERLYDAPPMAPMRERLAVAAESGELTAEERQQIRQLLEEYRQWEERRSGIDPVQARRHREAAGSLAMILVGLPLYLYHWRRIRVETAERRARRDATGGTA
jgi:hypothetical protein